MEAREECRFPEARGTQAQADPQEPELDPDLGSHRPPGGLLLENKSVVPTRKQHSLPTAESHLGDQTQQLDKGLPVPRGCPRAP